MTITRHLSFALGGAEGEMPFLVRHNPASLPRHAQRIEGYINYHDPYFESILHHFTTQMTMTGGYSSDT